MASSEVVVHASGHLVVREADGHTLFVVQVVTDGGHLVSLSVVDTEDYE